jgi:hypothetical protein
MAATLALAGDTMLGRGVAERLTADPEAALIAASGSAGPDRRKALLARCEAPCSSTLGEDTRRPVAPHTRAIHQALRERGGCRSNARSGAQKVTRAWSEWLAADRGVRAELWHCYLSALAEEERAAAALERTVDIGQPGGMPG